MSLLVKIGASYLAGVNLLVFCLMAYDKRQARRGAWRIKESQLLFLGMIGGGAGGELASRLFHHKTRKKKFLLCFVIGILLDCAIIYSLYQVV